MVAEGDGDSESVLRQPDAGVRRDQAVARKSTTGQLDTVAGPRSGHRASEAYQHTSARDETGWAAHRACSGAARTPHPGKNSAIAPHAFMYAGLAVWVYRPRVCR